MQLITELRAEHDLIEQALGALRTFVDQRVKGEGNPEDGPRFIRFFRQFIEFHHAREEQSLFQALIREAEIPEHRGPIAALTADHRRLAGLLDRIEPLIAMRLSDEAIRRQLSGMVKEYSHSLWHHIDAEDSVLLPESEARLRKHGVDELASRPMNPEESEAQRIGEELLRRYPPTADPDIIRGDGCVMCPAFAESCDGLEREWWNDWEWEEFEDHLPSG